MTLEQYAYLAEILGVIIVVVTLIYLAIQTKQNTDAVQSSVRQAMLQEDRESLRMVVENPALNRRSNLSGEEETQVQAFLIHFLRARENHWLQYKHGVLDEATWISYRGAMIPVIFSSAYGRALWANRIITDSLDPGFRAAIDRWIQGVDIQDSDVMLVPIETSTGK